MDCLHLADGDFTDVPWRPPAQTTTSSGIRVLRSPTHLMFLRGELASDAVASYPRPPGVTARFALFGEPRDFLAVMVADSRGGTRTRYRIELLDSTRARGLRRVVLADFETERGVKPEPFLQCSGGGGGILLLVHPDLRGENLVTAMFRSDDGTELLRLPPLPLPLPIRGVVRPGEIVFTTGEGGEAGLPRPAGRCELEPNPVRFDAAVGGAPAFAAPRAAVAIRNTGNDCLTNLSIDVVPPFFVEDDPDFPRVIPPGGTAVFTLRFEAAGAGFGTHRRSLRVHADSPAAGTELVCEGNVRTALPLLRVPEEVDFGVVVEGKPQVRTIRIESAGELDARVDVAARDGAFSWPKLAAVLPPGKAAELPVTYHASETEQAAVLPIDTDVLPPGVRLKAKACVPRGVMEVVEPDVHFGVVRRGTQARRRITVRNRGNGTLSFGARTDDITFAVIDRDGRPDSRPVAWELPPTHRCDGGDTGFGVLSIELLFFAIGQADGPHAATLTLATASGAEERVPLRVVVTG